MRKILATSIIIAAALSASCTPENTTAETPEIQVQKSVTVDTAGGEFTLDYTILSPVEGATLTAKAENCDWISIQDITEASVIAEAEANQTTEARSAEITLSYPGAESVTVTVNQNGKSENPDGPIDDTGLSFDIEILSVGSRSVVLNCIPSDLEATYIAMTSDKDDYYSLEEGSEEFFAQDINYFIEWGMAFGDESTTEEEAISMFLRTGAMENYEITLDKPMSEYVFYAYGLNPDGTVTSQVFKKEFTTTEPEAQDCTFDFLVRPSLDGIRINVIPSSINVQYYWSVMEKSEFDAYGADAAGKIAQQLLEEAQSSGTGMGQVLFYHNQSDIFSELTEGGSYVVFAFGCDVTGVVTTELMKKEFTAETLDKISCNFTVSTVENFASTFTVRIEPTDPDAKWFAYTLPYELLESYYSPEDMTDEVLDILSAGGIDWATDTELVHTGTQTLTNYDMVGDRTEPQTRQFIGVMAISEYGTRISDLTIYSLTTAEDEGTGDVNIDVSIEILDRSAENASVKFSPYPAEQYVYGVLETSFFDGYESDSDKIAAVLSYYVINDLLRMRQSYEDVTFKPENITAGTEYTAFAFGYTDIVGKTLFSETFVAE